ncbi:MAG: WD40 repeat domain-containing protein, partial [Cyanobacteria bacterium P01_C01_bin.118]
RQAGSLTVLPTGGVEFFCTVDELEVSTNTKKKNTINPSVSHTIELNNNSNVSQTIAMTLNRVDIPWYRKVGARLRRLPPTPANTTNHLLHLNPVQVELKAGDIAKMALTLSPLSPLLGWRRRQQFQLRPQLQQTEICPPTQTVDLVANPKIPFWLQCVTIGGVSLAAITALCWPTGHRGPVNSVQFDGQANAIISGSDDHTLHHWQITPRLKDKATLKDTDKAIRVVRYRPRNNDLLAVGLENGEIQLWDFLSQQRSKSLVFQRDDRVFDLRFNHDSQQLFSAHGSGLVLRWAINDLAELGQRTAPKQQHKFGFAVQSISPISYFKHQTSERQTHLLAIAGRFNRLILWDFEQRQQQSLTYPQGKPNEYLTSLDTAEDNSTHLAAADNQGRITLWHLEKCLKDNSPCKPSDQWDDGHKGKPVNTVALSKDACYLVSGGGDGRVMLWSLNTTGQVMAQKQLARVKQPVNSVDIRQQGNALLVVSGSDTHQVKLHRTQANNKACP